MKTITIWSAAMSVFFSLSLSASVYEAGRDYMQAGAGNPAAVERSLAELVGRMGGSAEVLKAPQRQPAGTAVATARPEIRSIFDWVRREGRPSHMDAPIATQLGLGPSTSAERIPVSQKAYRAPDDESAIYGLLLVAEGERQHVVLLRRTSQVILLWRLDREGAIMMTVEAFGESVVPVPNDRHRAAYQKALEFFIHKAAQSKVG